MGQPIFSKDSTIVQSLILKMLFHIQNERTFPREFQLTSSKNTRAHLSCFFPFCQFRMKCSSSSRFNSNRYEARSTYFHGPPTKAETKLVHPINWFLVQDAEGQLLLLHLSSYSSGSDEVCYTMNVRSMLLDGMSLFPLFL